MKLMSEVLHDQQVDVARYRAAATHFAEDRISRIPGVAGALLSGSAARGDARLGPYGLLLDIVVVHQDGVSLDPVALFGPSSEPEIPFHCVTYDGLGYQIEFVTIDSLLSVRDQPESVIYARWESLVLLDPQGHLARWKNTTFLITPEQARHRALTQFWRYQYLTGEYRIEKWARREAWIQVTQLLNEACECFCAFLHCVNSRYVPRKDWLVYLTFELPEKPPQYGPLIDSMYTAAVTSEGIRDRLAAFILAQDWMHSLCVKKGWL